MRDIEQELIKVHEAEKPENSVDHSAFNADGEKVISKDQEKKFDMSHPWMQEIGEHALFLEKRNAIRFNPKWRAKNKKKKKIASAQRKLNSNRNFNAFKKTISKLEKDQCIINKVET